MNADLGLVESCRINSQSYPNNIMTKKTVNVNVYQITKIDAQTD